jgi:3-isopropylmalate dehydrogenase
VNAQQSSAASPRHSVAAAATSARPYRIAVLPGDGIGPEVTAESVRVLEQVGQIFGHRFEFTYDTVGGAAIDQYGTALRKQTLAMAKRSHAVLFGAVGGPKWDDPKAQVRPEDAILGLRKGLGLFANLRPTRAYPALIPLSNLKEEVIRGVDFLFVRETTGGTYFGKPKRFWHDGKQYRGVDTCLYTEAEVERVVRVACELARKRRRKVHSLDKVNVQASSRLWRHVATRVAAEYPDLEFNHMLADAAAMHMIRRPTDFDVLVADNLFGDILTDEAAMLAGSMGMMPSATLRTDNVGLYEPIHGSAPDIAGKGLANPLASILSAAMLLRYSLGLEHEARAVEMAVESALDRGLRTADLAADGPHVSTRDMADAVLASLSVPIPIPTA